MVEEAMEIMLHFCSSQVSISKEKEGDLIFCTGITWKQLCNLAGAQQGGIGICLVCGNVSPFIIFISNFPIIEPAQILEQYKL
jgi:uroporphyrinogen-III decarboxylase